jgi:flagellar hook assembly protein FlgD
LTQASAVDLRIFSTSGELVRVVESGTRESGMHQVIWDGRDELGRPVGRGTWFCRMTAGSFQAVSKLTTIQ